MFYTFLMPRFVHLHTHSHYSLLDGLSKIDDLVAYTKELGMDTLAITDHGNMYGAFEFYLKAKKAGIKAIIGAEMYMARESRLSKVTGIDNVRYHLILLVKNKIGYQNLCKLITKSNLEGFYYKPRIDKELLQEYKEGLICLSGCLGGEVMRALEKKNFDDAKRIALEYKNIFGNDYYLEIQPHNEKTYNHLLVKLSEETKIPLVATQDSHYLKSEDAQVHEVLLAIQTNNRLDNADRFSFKDVNVSLRSPEEMKELMGKYPDAIQNTVKIAEQCNFSFDFGTIHLPEFQIPKGETSMSYLRKLVHDRLPERYHKPSKEIRERIEYELSVIEKTGFADYFLIVQDFINWAKLHGIVVGPGRGSAAGSIVSYILRITDVDPLVYNLLFERFLNPERNEMPDIDIDFTDERRDEVLGYIKNKYGYDRVAQIITFGTMAARASVRDAGRALGLPYAFCDKIAKMIPFQVNTDKSESQLARYIEDVPDLKNLYESDRDAKRIIDAAMKLEGVARHASVHACGTVISRNPLTNYMPLQRSPQDENAVITQFEMHSVEGIGLLKIDLLGLKNLTIIENAINLVRELRGEEINISDLPLDDKATFKILQEGDTTGIFQLESSGMRRYLKELKPTEFEDIVAMISLYRPGPMELIPSYIKRKYGKEKITYLHPKLEPILSPTYGVGIYQEQMMRIARDLAGFTLPEADTLRKAIGKKIKKLLDEQQEKLTQGMIKNGIPKKIAEAIWELFPPFARYGFNRSHAVSYATISYQTAYLKARYPVEFMTSLLNIAQNDIDRINFLVTEARRLTIKVLPPDINTSSEGFTIQNGNIRFGLLAIKNIGSNIVKAVIDERTRGGPFVDITDFLNRVRHRDLNKKSLESFIKGGVFDYLDIERGQALSNIEELLRFNQIAKKSGEGVQDNLFGSTLPVGTLKLTPAKPIERSLLLAWEKELLGLYVTDHPFAPYEEKVKGRATPLKEIEDMHKSSSPKEVKVAGVITAVQKILTKRGDAMLFVTIEDLTGKVELLIFSDILTKTQSVWQMGKPIHVRGKVSWRDDAPKIICEAVKELI